MSNQVYRLDKGGRIYRDRPVTFSFNGKSYTGYEGDTLASALLATGVFLLARSFKYHRPRGVSTAGSEEPAALVTVGEGARAEPNTRATVAEIYDGMVARSQNAWPALGFDVGAINNLLSPFFSAGFYYKTFMWPGLRGWYFYERFIRAAAGMGKAPREPDPDTYDRREAFCDVLVVGGGPAGIAAALQAIRVGKKVMLVEEHAVAGGSRVRQQSPDALSSEIEELRTARKCTLLTRCTAFGFYDGNVVGLVERLGDHLPPGSTPVRQRHWIVRADEIVLETGAIERPMLFADNDRPGIMLASAAQSYLNEYAVCPGRNIVVATNNDSAYETAFELAAHASVTITDSRDSIDDELKASCIQHRINVHTNCYPVRALGKKRIKGVRVARLGKIRCDLLITSGGWSENIQLKSQLDGKPAKNIHAHAFDPGGGRFESSGKVFVDLQNDVTIADLRQGVSEGYSSAELLKRYTTLGMGTDQGKTSSINGMMALSELKGEPPESIGMTTYRPPYTPVALGAIAGRKVRKHFLPVRKTPFDDWHRERGAVMDDAGLWKRPLGYPRPGEDRMQWARREASLVRTGVATCDVSTLGKIDVQGPDSAEFLERLYVNRWKSLAVGKARYGIMLRDDGFVYDDGTTSRLGEQRYLMTTTTSNASSVLSHLEYHLQFVWPDLRVNVTDVTDYWAALAVAGPKSRDLLVSVFGEDAVGADVLPFMGVSQVEVMGMASLVLRVSFSGELGYEIYVPATVARQLIDILYEKGEEFGVAPYGLDAMEILRVEKGHVTGTELDGHATLADIGLEKMARPDGGYIGHVMAQRTGLVAADRKVLIGLRARRSSDAIVNGAHVVANEMLEEPAASLGHVSASCPSPALDCNIALAMVQSGRERLGSTVYISDPLGGTHFPAEVVSPHFFDPKGDRQRG